MVLDFNRAGEDIIQPVGELIATVRNSGVLGVPAGVEVRFYADSDATGTLIDTQLTGEALPLDNRCSSPRS